MKKAKLAPSSMISEFPIGMKFTTKGDFGDLTYQVMRQIELLPYIEGKGYSVKTSSIGKFLEVKNVKFDKKARYRPLLADRIGFYGGTWYMRIPEF